MAGVITLAAEKPMPNINTIHCGNHLDILKEYPDGFFDMVLTSPPYDNLRDYEGYDFQFEPLAHELYRVLKNGGVCVWVVNDATVNGSETLTSFKQAIYFKENVGFNVHDTMIYHKENPIPQNANRYEQSFEYSFILSKGRINTFNALKRKCLHGGKRIKRTPEKKTDGVENQREGNSITTKAFTMHNIFTYKIGTNCTTKDAIAFNHHAIFPEKLAEDHILSWSNPGDIILDPMCGSGTTCKMAVKHQRQYVGIDIAEKYCDIAEERIRKFTQQTNMFDMAGYNNCVQRTSKPRAAVEIPARY